MPPRGSLWAGLALAVTAGFLAVAPAAAAPGTPDAREAQVHPPGFVGEEVCASCHPQQRDRWQRSHHAKAMQPATGDAVLGRFDGQTISDTGITATLFRREGRPMMRTPRSDGTPADFAVAYSLGVAPLQQYLTVLPDHRIQVLPLAWDDRPVEQGGQRWFNPLPDGEDRAPGRAMRWTGRNQTWNALCADCHATGVSKAYRLAEDQYATSWSDLAVTCEACHGPGAGHLAWLAAVAPDRRQGETGGQGGAKGFAVALQQPSGGRWGDLDGRGIRRWSGPPRSDAEQNVCAPCHARRRAISDHPQPGAPFLDQYLPVLLDRGLYEADGQFQGEVFEYGSFQQSRMHQAGVTCSDCHEPHSLTPRATGNALCGQCHDPARFDQAGHHHHAADTPGAQCLNCHMPQRVYMGIDRRHDHSFRLPRPDLTVALGTPNACSTCHSDKTPAWAAAEIARWGGPHGPERHDAAILAQGRRDRPDSDRGLAELSRDPDSPAIVRATALSLLASRPSPAGLAALRPALVSPNPLLRLGAVRGLAGYPAALRWVLASSLLEDPIRAVRIETGRMLAAEPPPDPTPPEASALSAALGEWISAETLAADRPESHLTLGALWAEQGRLADAEAAYRTALRLDPHFASALINLADLERARHHEANAEALLRQAIQDAPDDADPLYALALSLIRQGRRVEAKDPLQRAMALQPDNHVFAHAYELLMQDRSGP